MGAHDHILEGLKVMRARFIATGALLLLGTIGVATTASAEERGDRRELIRDRREDRREAERRETERRAEERREAERREHWRREERAREEREQRERERREHEQPVWYWGWGWR